MTQRFVEGVFDDDYDPTIETETKKLLEINKVPIVVAIVDTAGQDEYSGFSRKAVVG